MGVIQASIPIFFLLIAAELAGARVRGHRVARLNDSIADLSLGILSQLTGIATKLLTVGLFAWVGARWSAPAVGLAPAWPAAEPATATGALTWTIGFLLVDLAYYWSHRLSHEVNILWAGHVVHHSSEEYNLTVALRQSSLHGLFTWVFYLPLAVLGMPWEMFVVCYGLNLVYQFWIHTREVGRLGVLEWFLNTPSHHRVHHGVNPKYQDRNYAGVFIIWDRLFGTFTPEEEEPVYGITKPLASWNPLWANVHVFAEIGRNLRRAQRWRDRLRVVFGSPSWRPPEAGPPIVPPEVSVAVFEKYDPPVPAPLSRYALVQFLVALAASVALLEAAGTLPLPQLLAAGFYVVLTLSNLGSLLELRRWVTPLEVTRHVVLAGSAAVLLATASAPAWLAGAGLGISLASLGWFLAARRWLESPELAAATAGGGGGVRGVTPAA